MIEKGWVDAPLTKTKLLWQSRSSWWGPQQMDGILKSHFISNKISLTCLNHTEMFKQTSRTLMPEP